jgi:phosphotransferase system enzyme I (PtsP)
VPIVRRERCVGVVCVQHVDPRRYEEVEIEALQTVAMVLSELIANADLVDEEEAAGLAAALTGPEQMRGLTLVKGWPAEWPSITSRASTSNISSPRIPRPSVSASTCL